MYNGLPVFDVHGHMSAPQATYGQAMFMLASNQPLQSRIGKGGGGKRDVPVEEYRAAAQTHINVMDDRNIDVQIIGPRPFMVLGWMQDHLIPGWARFVNDITHQQVGFFPARLLGAAQLPLLARAADTANCIPELDRCVQELGFAAAYVSPDPGGNRETPGMHEPYWYPLYERCQELGVTIIVHGTNALDPRYRVVPQNYQLGFLTEQYLAGQFLSHSDVFDRYPELRVLICHCGGALDRWIPTDPHLAQKDLSRNLFYDTCAYDVNFLEAAIKQRGVSRLCFGTEAPGSGGAVRPETGRPGDDLLPVIDSFGFLSEQDKFDLVHHNPVRLFPGLAKFAQRDAASS